MGAEPPKRGLSGLFPSALARTAREGHTNGEHAGADQSDLWSAHERALASARGAGAACQRVSATATRQRATFESAAERARTLAARLAEVQSVAGRVLDSFERLGLVGLNAGLEGARVGEAEGRQLALVGEEVRGRAARGADAGRDLAAHLQRLAADLAQLEADVGQAQAVVAEVTREAANAAGAASETEAALVVSGERIRKATGSDPEVVRGLADAVEGARALVASLVPLRDKVPRALLVGVLRPIFEPLERVLGPEAAESDENAER
jgi:methyl-accepting chemotaxis protein